MPGFWLAHSLATPCFAEAGYRFEDAFMTSVSTLEDHRHTCLVVQEQGRRGLLDAQLNGLIEIASYSLDGLLRVCAGCKALPIQAKIGRKRHERFRNSLAVATGFIEHRLGVLPGSI